MREHWITYGRGICVDSINSNTTVEKLENLLALAPELKADIEDYFNACLISDPGVDDYLEYDDSCFGVAFFLQKVIEEIEGIRFTACDNDAEGENTVLLYEPKYPWLLSFKEKDLTEEKIDQILQKYVSILTDTPVEIKYFAAHGWNG